MSRVFRFLGTLFGGLLLIVGLAALLVFASSNAKLRQTFTVAVQSVPIPADEAAFARGRHLAHTRGCVDCHGTDFGGAKVIDDGAMGTVHGPNLTRGRGGRVARFSDEDWIRAIRHGVGPDQHGLLIMPSEEYSHFSDADLGALIAYLKSVPAVDRERVPTSLGPVARVLLATGKIKLAAETIDHANLHPPTVEPGVTEEYGEYVAASCTGCHGSNFSGGKIAVGPPNWPEAANLTPHSGSRIGKWTEQDFLNVLRTGQRPDGTQLDPVMPRTFGAMNDTELRALWKYFRSLPAVAKGTR